MYLLLPTPLQILRNPSTIMHIGLQWHEALKKGVTFLGGFFSIDVDISDDCEAGLAQKLVQAAVGVLVIPLACDIVVVALGRSCSGGGEKYKTFNGTAAGQPDDLATLTNADQGSWSMAMVSAAQISPQDADHMHNNHSSGDVPFGNGGGDGSDPSPGVGDAMAASAAAAARAEPPQMFCMNCGTQRPGASAKFCPGCATPFPDHGVSVC